LATECQDCPLRRKPIFEDMSAEDLRFMQRFKVGEMVVDPGTPILMEGSNSPQLYTALRGMGLRYKLLPNGRRHVVSMVFPGDFVGLQAGVMGEMGHSVEATTHMALCVFDRSELWSFFKDRPERAYALTWLAAVEEHFLGESLSTLGQRTAKQSIAWALTRIFIRGTALGLVRDNAMPLPFKQQDLADALGLSLVHTNKTLKALKDQQLVNWSVRRNRAPAWPVLFRTQGAAALRAPCKTTTGKEYTVTQVKGRNVAWDWGNGTAKGKVDEVFEKSVTRTIKGTEVTRNGSSDDPALLIKQEDGDKVLKLKSEVSFD